MTKRTRYIRNFVITVPRVAIREPGVYQIQMKVSAVFVEKVGELPKAYKKPRDGAGALERDYLEEERPPRGSIIAKPGTVAGEIERGSIDRDERHDPDENR